MTMAQNASRYDWDTWLVGIMRSFIAGGAGVLAGGTGPLVLDPAVFNVSTSSGVWHTLASMGIGFLIAGITAMGTFLKTHGAPDQLQQALENAAANAAQTSAAISDAKAAAPASNLQGDTK